MQPVLNETSKSMLFSMNAEFSHAEPYGRAHLILMLREKMFLQRRRQNRNDHIRRRRIHLIDDGIQIPHTINSTYNGFEYHKGSEINVAVTDFMLVLGHTYDIKNNSYDVSQATVFFVPKGTAIEMYQTTLHLSPLRVCDEGFKGIVILPRGTNTPLEEEELKIREEKRKVADEEAMLLLQRNKWVIAHPAREPLIRQGAYPGVTGENKELFYPGNTKER